MPSKAAQVDISWFTCPHQRSFVGSKLCGFVYMSSIKNLVLCEVFVVFLRAKHVHNNG